MDKKNYKVFDYLEWRGDLDFDASPFNEIDAAILCLLSYLDFTGLVPKEFSGEMEFANVKKFYYSPLEASSSSVEKSDKLDISVFPNPCS